MPHQRLRDAALLLALFDERLEDAMTVAHAAGDDVVELVRRHALVGRAPPDPQMHPAIDKAIAVEVDAIGAHAEKRHGAAVEPEDRRLAPARHHVEGLVAPFRDALFDDERLHDVVDRGADRIGIALGNKPHLLRFDDEHRVEPRERSGVVAAQPTDPPAARQQWHDPAAVEIVAGADMVGEGHSIWLSL